MKESRDSKKIETETVFQHSAGGVVFRVVDAGPEVVIIKTAEEGRWQIPKGLIDQGESAEEAAIREVREETGLECEIIAPLDTIEYWFFGNYDGPRKRYHKRVDFYLMRAVGGDTNDHDSEVVEARWVSLSEAETMLSFENERQVLAKAAKKIATLKQA